MEGVRIVPTYGRMCNKWPKMVVPKCVFVLLLLFFLLIPSWRPSYAHGTHDTTSEMGPGAKMIIKTKYYNTNIFEFFFLDFQRPTVYGCVSLNKLRI